MGIVNASPDSFSGDGLSEKADAVARAIEMIDAGGDIIDVGGESTRPGFVSVDPQTELERVIPVIKSIRKRSDAIISVDTTKAAVLAQAIEAGADILNCVAIPEDELLAIAVSSGIPIVLTDDTARKLNDHDVVGQIISTLSIAIAKVLNAGASQDKIIIDPGIGFGKKPHHNIQILRELDRFKILGLPLLIGTSRKSFIGELTDRCAPERDFGTAATVALAVAKGADIVRVHNVHSMRDVVRVSDSIVRSQQGH